MAGHGMGGGGGGQFGGVMRSMRRDDSVTQQQVTKGTARRMIRFARPYRKHPGLVPGAGRRRRRHRGHQPAAVPLDHRQRASPSTTRASIIGLALVAAVLALADAGLSIGMRWVSAKVGEGLIFDMRSKVFDHIQKMPIAFFTRTQTGALDQPAEQRRDRRPAGLHRHLVVGGRPT